MRIDDQIVFRISLIRELFQWSGMKKELRNCVQLLNEIKTDYPVEGFVKLYVEDDFELIWYFVQQCIRWGFQIFAGKALEKSMKNFGYRVVFECCSTFTDK